MEWGPFILAPRRGRGGRGFGQFSEGSRGNDPDYPAGRGRGRRGFGRGDVSAHVPPENDSSQGGGNHLQQSWRWNSTLNKEDTVVGTLGLIEATDKNPSFLIGSHTFWYITYNA